MNWTVDIPDHSCYLLCAGWYDFWHFTVCYYDQEKGVLCDEENNSNYEFSVFNTWAEIDLPKFE